MLNRYFLILLASSLFAADKVSKPGPYRATRNRSIRSGCVHRNTLRWATV
jgi:hypothetical protein